MIKKKNISSTDAKIWEEYIKNPTDISIKDIDLEKKHTTKSRFKYDLHGFTLEEANKKVEEIILSCSKKNYKEILLITGKGIHSDTDQNVYVSQQLSKLRYSVPEYINSNPNLLNFVSTISMAKLEDGGDGAIVIKLKKL